MPIFARFAPLLAAPLVAFLLPVAQAQSPRLFAHDSNIGQTQPGGSQYQADRDSYRVQGGGFDVWSTHDDFHLTWLRFQGDGSLTADVQVAQPAVHPKAKGMLMFRQSLDPGAAYADVALHGDGHIDLQWRAVDGGETKDTDVPAHGANRIRIVRKGDLFTAYTLTGDQATAGPSISVPMHGTVYVGLGVCSHSTTALQTVDFSGVQLEPAANVVTAP